MTGSKVAVIGGGISGLAAAYFIKSESPDTAVTVFEKDARLGGKLRTEELEDARVEAGADSFLVREPHALNLAQAVGLADELVEPGVFGGLMWDGRKLSPMPREAVMGIPVSAGAVWRAESLSVPAKLRALGDLVRPGRLAEEDVPVGPFLRKRFGRGLTDRVVDPILAGTRSGEIDTMSLRYALPQVFDGAQKRSSVIRSMSKLPGSGAPVFKTPRDGMSSLIEKIASAVSLDIRTGSTVRSVTRSSVTTSRDGWTVSTENDPPLTCDAVVVALPFHQAATVLQGPSEPELQEMARAMRSMPHASVASIALAYPAGEVSWPQGSSGFLVPSKAQKTLAAGTWWSAKWPHTVGGDSDIVRCFVGRSGRHPALDLDDDELVRRAAEEIRAITGAEAPRSSRVDRWDEGLPQFEIGHHQRLGAIERAAATLPGLQIAGPDLTGSGVPECIRRASAAAERTIAHLGRVESGQDDGGSVRR